MCWDSLSTRFRRPARRVRLLLTVADATERERREVVRAAWRRLLTGRRDAARECADVAERENGRARCRRRPLESNPPSTRPATLSVCVRMCIYVHGRDISMRVVRFLRDSRAIQDAHHRDDDTTTTRRLRHGGKRRPSLRLAGHATTDELWPMNVLALWTRLWRREHALFERGTRMHGRATTAARCKGI